MALQRALEPREVEHVRVLVERALERDRRPVVVAVERLALVPVVGDEVPGAEDRVVLLDPHPELAHRPVSRPSVGRGRLDGTVVGRTAGMGRFGLGGAADRGEPVVGPWRRVTALRPVLRRSGESPSGGALQEPDEQGGGDEIRRGPRVEAVAVAPEVAVEPPCGGEPPRGDDPARPHHGARPRGHRGRRRGAGLSCDQRVRHPGHQLEMGLRDGVEQGEAATRAPGEAWRAPGRT